MYRFDGKRGTVEQSDTMLSATKEAIGNDAFEVIVKQLADKIMPVILKYVQFAVSVVQTHQVLR